MKRFYIILFITILSFSNIYATHNRAGQIIYRHISGYTYEIEIWTYTYTKSAADRTELPISWGDGTIDTLPRIEKNTLPNFYYENIYIGQHTFPGPGTFVLVAEDPNRNEGVLNIPNSINVMFALTSILQINPFLGHNNAPILYTKPIDKAAVGQVFIHNAGAYDVDGDSLSFKMDTCRYDDGAKIPGFSLPPASTNIYVDPISGDLIWDAPTQVGIYNVAMKIEEWRDGVIISNIIRDIQIEVEETDNQPPVIDPIEDLCVVAGDYIEFDVYASDPDSDYVQLEATGAPFFMDISPAEFPDSITGLGEVTGTFKWQTVCDHISYAPYIVTFKATDDNPEVSLTDYQTMDIKVIGPAVQFTSIENSNTNVILKWDKATCNNAIGYKIYRRNSTENFEIADCQTGIPDEWGYELIKEIDNPQTNFYVNSHVTPGFNYCYRIVVVYEGNYDGIPSEKQCIEIAEGVPILTMATVLETDANNGEIQVEWIHPINFDTIAYQGPFRYLLEISRDLYGLDYSSPIIFDGLTETSYSDLNINTIDDASCYRLTLQNYDTLSSDFVDIGYPSVAASPFLRIESANRRNDLYIDENVPWDNTTYVIYRKNDATGDFDSIGVTQSKHYRDANLINLKEYCYKVKTIGFYSADSLIDKQIINFSQINCGVPVDTIPPCCPDYTVDSECDLYRNVIQWQMPADSCYDGLAEVQLFFKNRLEGDSVQIATFTANDSIYYHYPEISLAGCYSFSAIDSAGNQAICPERQCIDICTYYELPNIFTPNSDNVNDLYHPYPYKFVESVDMKIYNRWGDLVYETTDPDINWDGKNINSGQLVPEGVYYYICDVYEERLTGVEPRNISGFIHIYYQKDGNRP